MRILVRPLIVIAVAALFVAGVLLASEAVSPWFLLYLGAPTGLAAALVVARKYPPLKAASVGALVTLGIVLLFVLPGIVVKWLSGDWASGPYCDGFCMTNTGGFIFALFVLMAVAVPAAVAGGFISAIASIAGVRPARDS